MPPLSVWLAVAAGGALGSAARFACSLWAAPLVTRSGFPWSTLAVNVVGSALLGWLGGFLPTRAASPAVVASLTAGLCGGFTTMSAFAWEAVQLATQGAYARSAAYILSTTFLSVAAAALGFAVGRPSLA